jgi:hypothetical protein
MRIVAEKTATMPACTTTLQAAEPMASSVGADVGNVGDAVVGAVGEEVGKEVGDEVGAVGAVGAVGDEVVGNGVGDEVVGDEVGGVGAMQKGHAAQLESPPQHRSSVIAHSYSHHVLQTGGKFAHCVTIGQSL